MSSSTRQKQGHRRVSRDGQVTFKRRATREIMNAIQLGIEHSVSRENSVPLRDLLTPDFYVVESVDFPRIGGRSTPAHSLSNFSFKCYAPTAFRHFRRFYGIDMAHFLHSICGRNLLELSNAGASGSIFYRTADDCLIIKTVQSGEAKYLRRLLQQYYITLTQNPGTLLPKFYGLYCYRSGSKRIRFVVMNNLLPSVAPISVKFDLKGSTYKRRASPEERSRPSPTLKDLDFREAHPNGLQLEPQVYEALIDSLARDCLVLRSFSIMDYSLLVAVHNLDHPSPTGDDANAAAQQEESSAGRVTSPIVGIPAKNDRGDRLLLYIGIIDILQDYRLIKRMEHSMWSLVTDGDSVSVVHPDFYSQRYQAFMRDFVFKREPSTTTSSATSNGGVGGAG